jgi:hypothetical protein
MNDKLTWRKASRSGGTGGNCVEVAALPDHGRAVRDSKNPDDAVLLLTADQWENLKNSLLPSKSKPPTAWCHPLPGGWGY